MPPLSSEPPSPPDTRPARRRRVRDRIPIRHPAELESLVTALGAVIDYRHLLQNAKRAREQHLRAVLGVPPLRTRASVEDRRAHEARLAATQFEAVLAGREPIDVVDVGLLDTLVCVQASLEDAERRLRSRRDAALLRFGPTVVGRTERNAPTSHERKKAFHHGDLREAAIRVAVTRMRTGGPLAVTLRGVARDLGATAPALMYYFRNLEGFRSEVAAALLEQLAVYTSTSAVGRVRWHPVDECPVVAQLKPRPPTGPTWAHDLAEGWLDYAVENPDLYRQIMGEGWHRPGLSSGRSASGVSSPRRHLQASAAQRLAGALPPDGAAAAAHQLAMSLHGLALCRIDGAPEPEVQRSLARILRPISLLAAAR